MKIRLSRKKFFDSKYCFYYLFLIYKVALEYGYWTIIRLDTISYRTDFNILKYINGLFWCSLLFFVIDYNNKKASSFLLYLMLITQIVPITIIYAFGNWSFIYYNSICFSILLCIVLVRIKSYVSFAKFLPYKTITKWLIRCFVVSTIIIFAIILIKNGIPSLDALNLRLVYKIRSSNTFKVNQYINYFILWVTPSLAPFFITKFVIEKKYVLSGVVCLMVLIIYLYTANKTFLFLIPVTIVCLFLEKNSTSCLKTIKILCFLVTGLTAGIIILKILSSTIQLPASITYLFNRAYDLFVRRSMLDSANNKFLHYDFFCTNPKLGLSGIFPGWLINIPSPYNNENYQILIGMKYLGKAANHGTGFLAEGFIRFGYIGIYIISALFAFLLRKIDKFQERTSFLFAVGVFAYPVYALVDAHLLDNLFMGSWTCLILILIFYKPADKLISKYKESVEGT